MGEGLKQSRVKCCRKKTKEKQNCQTSIQFKKLIITCSCFFTSLRCHQPKNHVSSSFTLGLCFFLILSLESAASSSSSLFASSSTIQLHLQKALSSLVNLTSFCCFGPFLHRPQINALSEWKKKTLLSWLQAWNTWKACISSLLCQKEDGGKKMDRNLHKKVLTLNDFLFFEGTILLCIQLPVKVS